jgi:hypothetical protein
VKDIRTGPENTILENGKTYLYRHNDCAVSLRRYINVVEKEIGRMLELAPLGIAIPVMGIVFEETVIDGYIMPLARAVPSDLDVSTKREYTFQILSLVERLHRQGIIHGDLKLTNFLLCDDGQVRLCDFEESQIVGEEPCPHCQTYGYRPPWRVRADWDDVPVPLSFDDDYYALGLAIWELWKGERVFQDLSTSEAESEFVIHGVVVDVDEVQDPVAIDTIWKLLEYGGRGTVKRDHGFRYKVTGSAYESMNTFEYARLFEERKKRWYMACTRFSQLMFRAALGWERRDEHVKYTPLEPSGDIWDNFLK